MDRSYELNTFNPPAELPADTLHSLPANLSAATNPTVRADDRVVHVLNRLGFGPRPGDIQNVQGMGVQRYIQQQLNPQSIPLPSWIQQGLANAKTLNKSPYALYQRNHPRNVRLQEIKKAEKKQGVQKQGKLTKEQQKAQKQNQVKAVLARAATESRDEKRMIQEQVQLPLMEAANARLLRAINSPRQLEEVMVNFWFNHFNVSKKKGYGRIWTGLFDERAIRPNAMGSFRELLGATAHHPAMLFYLDNFRSKAGAINENYARELLELHTLGVEGGYTQKDIQEVARVFTGWRYTPLENDAPPPLANGKYQDFFFDAKAHDSGSKTILGQTISGSGQNEGEQVLDLLAKHPSTAKHIAFKLSQYFVADVPPPSVVSKLASAFQSSNGNITTVLSTLFSSAEFWDARYFKQKFKTPYEYLISAYRVTGQTAVDTRKLEGMLDQLGMSLYGCETPDGYKNTQTAWLSPEAMMRRISFATTIANGELGGDSKPANPNQISQALGYSLSGQTLTVLKSSPAPLQATAILGSPEMMMR